MATAGEARCRPSVLTAGEDEWARVLVHGEVVQLQLTLCVDRQPAAEQDTTGSDPEV